MRATLRAEALPLSIWSWLLPGAGSICFKVGFFSGHYRDMHQADFSGRTLKNTA